MTMKQLRETVEKLSKPIYKSHLTQENQKELYNLLISEPCVNYNDFTKFVYNEMTLNTVLEHAKTEERRRKELGGVWYGYTEELIEIYREDIKLIMEEMDNE